MLTQVRQLMSHLPWSKASHLRPKSLDHVKRIDTETRHVCLNQAVNESMGITVESLQHRYGKDTLKGVTGYIDSQLAEQGMF